MAYNFLKIKITSVEEMNTRYQIPFQMLFTFNSVPMTSDLNINTAIPAIDEDSETLKHGMRVPRSAS